MNITDKEWVIVGLVILGVGCLLTMGAGAESNVNAIISGLCGIAVGKSMNQ
jgi:hypothetical protein